MNGFKSLLVAGFYTLDKTICTESLYKLCTSANAFLITNCRVLKSKLQISALRICLNVVTLQKVLSNKLTDAGQSSNMVPVELIGLNRSNFIITWPY